MTTIIIAAASALVLAVTAGVAAAVWPQPETRGKSADFSAAQLTDAPWQRDQTGAKSATIDPAWTAMNQALQKHDRAKFLNYATGQAQAQLAQWWDNTTAIGWDTAYILPSSYTGAVDRIFLGAQLAFDAHPVRGSGSADSGLRLTQGFTYSVTTTGSGQDERITSITPAKPMPWDDGPLYVVKRPHVVLYGMADEKALVDANADTAEKGAELAVTTIKAMGGDVPMDGFVAAITDSGDRLARWQFGPGGTKWDMDVAGYAAPALRPAGPSPLLANDIATGDATGGSLEVLGPLSADQRLQTFTHEFAHALTYAASPQLPLVQAPLAVTEGFARYTEYAAHVGLEPSMLDWQTKASIAANGADAFSDTRLRAKDSWFAYNAACSYYQFVAEHGGNPWKLELDGLGDVHALDATNQNPALSIAAWQAWAAAQ